MLLAASIPAFGQTKNDSIQMPSGNFKGLEWRIGAEVSPAYVFPTNAYLKGSNEYGDKIKAAFSAGIRADFSFNECSKWGILYNGAYHGLGIDWSVFTPSGLLGNPASVFIYQGAPVIRFNKRLSLDYEWKFGAAIGWSYIYDKDGNDYNSAISTAATARMSIAAKIRYRLSRDWSISAGIEGTHFSNGNTSYPNAGVNTLSLAIGFAYTIPSHNSKEPDPLLSARLSEEADRGKWLFDFMAYGAWRKRGINITGQPQILPGNFGVYGAEFSFLRKVNRYLTFGPAIDFMHDESAGLKDYWADGTYGDQIKFYRPPYDKQMSLGASIHAELTMPIFTINAGIGYDFLKPQGEERFFQTLSLKTFVTKNLYINTGYRLGNFKDPQNLMLGLGIRF